MAKTKINIFWFRRDLRLEDNTALHHALKEELPVLPIFIFDTNILDHLEDRDDARVAFIHAELMAIHNQLKKKKAGVLILMGDPYEVWVNLISQYDISQVFVNNDYEPYARTRDSLLVKLFESRNIGLNTFKDHVIFEKSEIVKEDGSPYLVFTSYNNRWKKAFTQNPLPIYPSALPSHNYYTGSIKEPPTLETLGFIPPRFSIPTRVSKDKVLERYQSDRNYPAKDGTSRLGVHLRFGTISIRALAKRAKTNSEVFLNELVWREFYQMILWHFPKVVDENFKSKFNRLDWRNDEQEFEAWCNGCTGYPIVDAGMRELNSTGYMHNRVRMIVASFLTKHLLIDWRWGEAYFAKKLLDFELASNNGGWQWAAGTGTDAQPYFRIFNPESQWKKFDPESKYIKKWIPELDTDQYPKPMVDHAFARKRVLETFKGALQAN